MEWKQIVVDGVEYDYEVSDEQGLVRNMRTGRILKARKNEKTGYILAMLYKNGKQKHFLVHRLVAIMWIPNPNNYDSVNHKDHNKENNNADNLEWMSIGDNVRDGRSKKVYCYELDQTFNSMAEAERETGVRQPYISACCQGKQKTAGKYHWKYVES